ncbi:hypothetical protein MCAV_06190 [[Mycoplasma] cavipharyngis]|uniref:hypothetical protein n=1 Tax=[Mycoplasma] cavipharyngis TaxID=92757 RepID=UPI0037046F6C
MKLKIKSNPLVLWIWLTIFVIVPIIVFYLCFGEINLLNTNWIIAKQQNTPYLTFPVNKSSFSNNYFSWVANLPKQYHEYFTNNFSNYQNQYYINNVLTINNQVQKTDLLATFFYPFATVQVLPLLIFLTFLFIYLTLLGMYHFICKIFLKEPILKTDSYVFLVAFWFVGLIWFYSGAFPGFANGSNLVWYVIIIRIIIILLAIYFGFKLPFLLFNYLNRNLNEVVYLNNLEEFKAELEEEKIDQKTNLQHQKKWSNFIKLRK